MKKIIFLMVCCLIAATQGIYAQNGKAFLQHNGNITGVFANNEIDKAIDAAAEGDTIFLSKGDFPGGITINKSICLIGSNSTSITDGLSNSWIKAQEDKAIASVSIEGIYFAGYLYVSGDVENLQIKKCSFLNGINLQCSSNLIVLDRCSINRLYGNSMYPLKNFTAKNCIINDKIDSFYGTATALCKFVNCNIKSIESSHYTMYVNSIINEVGNGTSDHLNEKNTLVNTLYHIIKGYDPMENASLQDCWSTTETLGKNSSDKFECALSAEQLKSAGYLGTDETVVGIEGGVNPFSLTLNSPSINSNSATVDIKNKKVTINVNVTAN